MAAATRMRTMVTIDLIMHEATFLTTIKPMMISASKAM